jgi:viologen exporter family transport system ATP-binding protein
VRVLGLVPSRERRQLAFQIGTVFGQRSQLWYQLPPRDTFELLGRVYEIDRRHHRRRLEALTSVFELGTLVDTPVRQLSLGERMRCEIVASLLHSPHILFLDEPTIGLDVSMQATVRGFIRAYNERFGATVLLTSHYMEDVAALCPRVMVIDKGRMIYDGGLSDLVRRVRPDKRMLLRLSRPVERRDLEALGSVIEHGDAEAIVQVSQDALQQAVARALSSLPLTDLTVEDPPLEEVMRDLFAQGRAA